MDLEMLIKMITKEVLSKVEDNVINNKMTRDNKKVLVIFNGSTIGLEESIKGLSKIKEYGFKMKAVLSEFSLNIINMNTINEIFDKEDIYIDDKSCNNQELYKENFDLLIGANLTINTVSKVSLGIGDTLETRLISNCIMNGTEIIAVKDACDLENLKGKEMGYKNVPAAFFNMLKGYLDRLESFGMRLINSNNIFEYATKEKDTFGNCNNAEVQIDKKIISREDIALNSKSKLILIPSYAIITSLAKELCNELGINIIKR